jgi:hypothetical protein
MALTVNPAGYEYKPGDANMEVAAWPPQVNAADVTRIISFFKAVVGSCVFVNPSAPPANDTLWASADANGDCKVLAADVTRLVAFFKGTALAPVTCVDYPAVTPIEANYPACSPFVPLKVIPNVDPSKPTQSTE